jgi:predicted Zn-dependent protease
VLGSTIDSAAAREVAMIVPAVGAQLLTQKYGRDAEREADLYGMRYMSEAGYDPAGAVELQKTFLKLADNRDPDWLSGLFASHPPSRERLEKNRKTARELPQEGETGRERYQEKTAYLRRVQPAYDAYDEAQKALNKDDRKTAQAKLDEALALEPRESLFHALQGDIYALEKKQARALDAYQEAIERNPGFFYGYLRAGQMQFALDRHSEARRNLDRSLELMPTAEAHYLLGRLDRDRGDLNSAVAHFRTAAESESESGQMASRELVLMDLERNPSQYIATAPRMDSSGNVYALLGNRTSVSVENLEISFAWLDDQGQTRQGRTTLRGPLGGGQQTQVSLGFRITGASDPSRRVRVEVTAARVAD